MKGRLVYISPDEATFTRKDIDFLSKYYEVVTFQQPWGNKSKIFVNILQQMFFLVRVMPGSKATLVMFGGYWAFLPALLGKILRIPVFIILGGADCVSFPEYRYGSLRKPILKKVIHFSYLWAKRLLPVDESLVMSDYVYDPAVKERRQGYQHYFPDLATPYTVINNGFNQNFWKSGGTIKNPFVFTTIAKVNDQSRFVTKGIDLVTRLAASFPRYKFNIIGMDLTFGNSLTDLPGNIIIHDYLSPDDVRRVLNESRFYLQLSISEGFPNALCEAMLCECIPICSAVGGMPYIVQDSGLLIGLKDEGFIIEQISALINKSYDELKDLGIRARNNIADRFPIEKREKALLELIEQG